MRTERIADGGLSPELEAIAAAAHERLKAHAGEDRSALGHAGRRVAQSAGAAIAAGARLSAIAEAEHEGELRARGELGGEVLRQVTRAAKRKREADGEYEQSVGRAGRLGLSHREIAAAAQVAHGTVRAILTRTSTMTAEGRSAETKAAEGEPGGGQPPGIAA
jgi:hypothetical protein